MSEDTSPGTSGGSGRKRYASTKTSAQIWTGRAVLGGIIAIVGLVLYNFGFGIYLLFASPKTEGGMLWATSDGIAYSKSGGERTGVFKLPGSTGEPVSNPRCLVIGDKFAYYDPQGQSLCVLAPGETPRWVDLAPVLGEAKARDLRPIANAGLLVVAYGKSDDNDVLPPVSAAAKYMFGSPDATAADPTDVRYAPDAKSTVAAPTPAPVSWDYDFDGQVQVASRGKSVEVNRGGATREFGLGVLYFIRHVDATAKSGEVWMTAVKPFKSGHLVLAYSADGKFQRVVLKDKSDLRPPFITATPELVELLTKASGGVQE